MQYWFATSTEEFTPSQMLEQAKAADRAGFDGLGTSDHFAPWFPDGQATQAWVYLGALGQVTQKQIGTGVTPIIHHYHPGLVAQAFMSLEELYPGPRVPRRRLRRGGQRDAAGPGLAALRGAAPPPGDGPGGDHAPVERRDRDDGRRLVQAQGRAPVDARARRGRSSTSRRSGRSRRRWRRATATASGRWAIPRRRRRSSRPTARPATTTAASPARSSSRPASPGPTTTARRSRARGTGSRPSCPSSTWRTSPTRRTCSAAPTSR